MAKRKLRIHTAAFKFNLVLEALKGDKTRVEIAREHDIAKSLLYKWEQLFLEQGADVFRSSDSYQIELGLRNERIADLERVVGRLALENEVLKKFEMKLDSPLGRSGR
jgi:putative transposase